MIVNYYYRPTKTGKHIKVWESLLLYEIQCTLYNLLNSFEGFKNDESTRTAIREKLKDSLSLSPIQYIDISFTIDKDGNITK